MPGNLRETPEASCSQRCYGLGLGRETRLKNKNTCVCVHSMQHWLRKLVITVQVCETPAIKCLLMAAP